MWIFENGTGLRVTAMKEDAPAMVADGSTHSCLWPRGTPEQEAAELQRLVKLDYYVRGEETPLPDSPEVHVQRRLADSVGDQS